MPVPALIRVAAVLHWFIAIGLGVFCLPAIRNLLSGRDIQLVMGFPAYGRGPFERIGLPSSVTLRPPFCWSACWKRWPAACYGAATGPAW